MPFPATFPRSATATLAACWIVLWWLESSPGAAAADRKPPFERIFIYSTVILEPGSATLILPDRQEVRVATGSGRLVPTGSTIRTGPNETARLRIGQGSHLRMGPLTEVVLMPTRLDLRRGTCLVKHGPAPIPLRLGGVATLTIEARSTVEAMRQADHLLLVVQAGRLRIPGAPTPLEAGQKAEIRQGTLRIGDHLPLPPTIGQGGQEPVPDESLGETVFRLLEAWLPEAPSSPPAASEGPDAGPAATPPSPPTARDFLRRHQPRQEPSPNGEDQP